ncbi:phosphoserine aminotransferase [Alphaproteobacteria bacterium]|nr:phosphoserine aminotransferase [Alphaproteobacteria bacterium]
MYTRCIYNAKAICGLKMTLAYNEESSKAVIGASLRLASGPCAKHPNWVSPTGELAGRSHRSVDGLSMIQEVLDLHRKILSIPDDYYIGIVSASSTGAMETLMWSLLGANGIDILSHCVFSKHWENDIVNELKLKDVRVFRAEFPEMADTSNVDFDRDVVFCWTSTTSGVSFKNADWIKSDRKGLTICDAASAMFMFDLDWSKLDATAFSWQKGLGGEAGFGVIVLSPRAIARLESYKPSWPMPRIFRIANDKKVNFDVFKGCTINTPSMICIEDFRNALLWAEKIGGIQALIQRIEANYAVVSQWVSQSSIFKFLVDEKYRAHHIACFDIVSEEYQKLSDADKWEFLKKIIRFCEHEKSGFDFIGHILTKPHLRVWCGPTIEADVLRNFLPKIESVLLT